MTGQTQWETDVLRGVTDTARDSFGNPISSDITSDGVKSAISAATREGNENTQSDADKASEKSNNLDRAAEDLDDIDKDNSRKTGDVDTKLSGDGEGRGGAGDGRSGALNSGVPTNQGTGGAPQAPQMPQMPMGGGSPMSPPSFPQMTQHDLNNAPNRDKLLSSNRDGDPSHGGTLGALSNDPDGRRAQELAEKLVNHDPPIPYVWGGGHGGAPGPSGGTRDGGVADSYGDYRKVGVDCSGLARWMTHQLYGVDPSGTSQSQYASGQPVSASHARPGDMFFPSSAGRPPHHVQVYVGNNMVIEAQKSGTFLKFSPLQSGEFRRFAH